MAGFEVLSGQVQPQSSSRSAEHFGQQRYELVAQIRSLVWILVLALALFFQLFQPQFIGFDIWFPILLVLGLHFSLSAIVHIFLWTKIEARLSLIYLLSFDILWITVIVALSGYNKSIFILLFSMNMILAGMILDRKGALLFALVTSAAFNFVLAFNPLHFEQGFTASLVINNISYFALAFLAGHLSEQLTFLGSQLRRTEKDVEVLKDLNQLVFENIATGLLVFNPFGLIIYSNESAKKILGIKKFEGKNLLEVFPVLEAKLSQQEVDRSPGAVTRGEERFNSPQLGQMILETLTSPLYSSEGALRGFLILFQDLTVVKRLEHEMRQKEKLAAVGQLAAGIAHEIRNPLASISGSIQLMTASSPAMTDEDRKLMSIVLKEIDRLNGLISEFLEFVRPEERAFDPINLNSLLSEVMESIRFNKTLRSDVQISLELNCGQMILGQRDKLKQAFLNIVINAFQAMEKAESPRLIVSTHDEADQVVVRFVDSGMGIGKESLDRIFEPFHTTKPKGTGLGLAITHKILESHSARVAVNSELGIGTEFRIFFPGERDSRERNYFDKKQA